MYSSCKNVDNIDRRKLVWVKPKSSGKDSGQIDSANYMYTCQKHNFCGVMYIHVNLLKPCSHWIRYRVNLTFLQGLLDV